MKQLVSLFLLLGVFFSACSSNDEQQQANAVTLHEAVYPIFAKESANIGCCYNTLSGDTLYGSINVYIEKDSSSWCRIFAPGSDTLFIGYYNNYLTTPVVAIITKESSREEILQMLGFLTKVLPSLVGYEWTLQIVEKFFDQESYSEYMTYVKKYEPVLQDALLRGKSSIQNGFIEGTRGETKAIYYSFTGPGYWRIAYNDGSTSLLLFGPFTLYTDMTLASMVSFHSKDFRAHYTCSPFGCQKGQVVDNKMVYTSISVSEFKHAVKHL